MLLIACNGEQKPKKEVQNPPQAITKARVPDSILIEKYFDYEYPSISYQYDSIGVVTKFEKDRDTASLMNFLRNNLSLIPDDSSYWPYKTDEMLKCLYEIDINGDGKKDIIYDGPSSGEGNMTKLFINENGQYKKVLHERQDITQMTFSDGRLSKLTISQPGCCADPQVLDFYYTISYSADKLPKFKLVHTIGYPMSYEALTSKYGNPIPFHTITDHTDLRDCCHVLDVEHPMFGDKGNMIAIYPKQAKGIALGEKIQDGITWIFVHMAKENKIKETQFPGFLDQPTETCGWIKKELTDLGR